MRRRKNAVPSRERRGRPGRNAQPLTPIPELFEFFAWKTGRLSPFPSLLCTPPPARCCCVSALGWRLLELAGRITCALHFAPVPLPQRTSLTACEPRRPCHFSAGPDPRRRSLRARRDCLAGTREKEEAKEGNRVPAPGPSARAFSMWRLFQWTCPRVLLRRSAVS